MPLGSSCLSLRSFLVGKKSAYLLDLGIVHPRNQSSTPPPPPPTPIHIHLLWYRCHFSLPTCRVYVIGVVCFLKVTVVLTEAWPIIAPSASPWHLVESSNNWNWRLFVLICLLVSFSFSLSNDSSVLSSVLLVGPGGQLIHGLLAQ